MLEDDKKVPDKAITTSVEPVDDTKPENVKNTGVKLKKVPPTEEKPSVTIDLTNVPQTPSQITVGGNIKKVTIVVKKKGKDKPEKPLTVDNVDKTPIVIMKDPKLEELFKDTEKVTLIPEETVKPTDKVYTVVVKINVCGEYRKPF